METLTIIGTAALVAFASLGAGILFLSGSKFATLFRKLGPFIAILILVLAVAINQIPEAITTIPGWLIAIICGGSLIVFSAVGKLASLIYSPDKNTKRHRKLQAAMTIIFDILATIMDAIVIGVAFSISFSAGILSSTAIAAYRIPRTINSFSYLRSARVPKKKAILFETLIALLIIPIAYFSTIFAESFIGARPYLASIIAGYFLYAAIVEVVAIDKAFRNH